MNADVKGHFCSIRGFINGNFWKRLRINEKQIWFSWSQLEQILCKICIISIKKLEHYYDYEQFINVLLKENYKQAKNIELI